MPKGLKLRRNFPYAKFSSWLNSDSKLSFDNYINIHTCSATLEMQNTNENVIMEGNKMIHSKEIFSEEKHELEKQILNHTSLDVEDSAELKMDTDFNLFNVSKTSLKLHIEEDKLNSNDHKLNSEFQNLCSSESAAESTKHKNMDAFHVVLSSNDSSESSLKKDLKLDDHELDFKDIFTKSEESIPQDGSPATNNLSLKICDDKSLNLNTVCVGGKDVFEEPFNTVALTEDKILSEANGDKYLISKTDNICENKVEKSVNGMISSMNTTDQKYASNTACVLHKLCKKQADKAHTDLPITTTSQKEIQLDNSYVLEKSESSDGKDLELDVPLIDAEKLYFEGISKESVPQDVTVASADLKIYDNKCLSSSAASAIEKNVFKEPLNAAISTTDKIFLEADNDKFSSSKTDNICENKAEKYINNISSVSTAVLDYEEDEVHKALLINTASSSPNVIQSVDYYILEEIESRGGGELDVREACAEKVSLEIMLAKSEESVPQDMSPVTSCSSNPEICDDKCLNIAYAVKRDDPFNTTAPIKEEICSHSDNNKSSSLITDNTFEHQVEKSVSGISSTNTASSNCNSASETNTKTEKALDESSNSRNNYKPFDFYELEKSDIEDPEWENIKKLKSNEERYKQVRECWDTKNIPNPNKNLTYHSYRKQKLKAGKLDDRLIKQHKRQASEKSALPPPKRTRYCTYTVDNRIQAIKSEQFSQTAIIQNEMEKQINLLDYNFNYVVSELNKHYYHFNYQNSRNLFMRDRDLLGMQYNQNLSDIKNKYYQQIDTYKASCRSKINKLQKAHDEILTFCNFYEGLREDNPTVLTEVQLQEIEEIDDVYEQLNKYYN